MPHITQVMRETWPRVLFPLVACLLTAVLALSFVPRVTAADVESTDSPNAPTTGTIAGKVVLPAGADPTILAVVSVAALPVGSDSSSGTAQPEPSATARPDQSGAYELTDLPFGSYYIQAGADTSADAATVPSGDLLTTYAPDVTDLTQGARIVTLDEGSSRIDNVIVKVQADDKAVDEAAPSPAPVSPDTGTSAAPDQDLSSSESETSIIDRKSVV